jgi:hypothetical protein
MKSRIKLDEQMPKSPPKLERNISCTHNELTLMRSQCALLETNSFLYRWRYVPILNCHEYCIVKPFETSGPLGYTYTTRLSTDNLRDWAFKRYFVAKDYQSSSAELGGGKRATGEGPEFKRSHISTYVIRNCILRDARL